jgi:hypothetical protein
MARVALAAHTAKRKTVEPLFALHGDAFRGDLTPHLQAARRAVEGAAKGDELEWLAAHPAEVYADDDGEDAAGTPTAQARIRLVGEKISNDRVRITQAYPAAGARALEDLLAILREVGGTGDRWGRDAAEARHIFDLANRSSHFVQSNPAQRQQNAISLDGEKITVQPDRRPYLALMVARHRLGEGPWDLRTAWTADETFRKKYDAYTEQTLAPLQKALDSINEQYAVKRGIPVFESPRGKYYATDLTALNFADGRSVAPHFRPALPDLKAAEVTLADALALVDTAMRALGLEKLGDYTGDPYPKVVGLRGYGKGRDGTFAALGLAAGQGLVQWTFYTIFKDGFWVVTGNRPLSPHAPRPKGCSRRAEKATIAKLFAIHEAHVATQTGHGAPSPSPALLRELVERNDSYLAGGTQVDKEETDAGRRRSK